MVNYSLTAGRSMISIVSPKLSAIKRITSLMVIGSAAPTLAALSRHRRIQLEPDKFRNLTDVGGVIKEDDAL